MYLTLLQSFLLSAFLAANATTAYPTWYWLIYNVRYPLEITSFHVQLTAPTSTTNDGYVVWAGLRPSYHESGLLRSWLESRSGSWQLTSFWYSWTHPDQVQGQLVTPISNGDLLDMNMRRVRGKLFFEGDVDWNVINTNAVSMANQKDTFTCDGTYIGDTNEISDNYFDQYIFAVEVNEGVAWDFGSVVFGNITIVAEVVDKYSKLDASFCTGFPDNFKGRTKYRITGAYADVEDDIGRVTCNMNEVAFDGPLV